MDRKEQALALRAQGKKWAEVAAIMGGSQRNLRRYAEKPRPPRHYESTAAPYASRPEGNRSSRSAMDADAAARLAEVPPDTRTVDERLTGCPLHGRRAIDRMESYREEMRPEPEEVPFQ